MMQLFLQTVVLRHRKENLNKCSLKGLEGRDDLHFFTYPKEALPDLTGYVALVLDAPPLTAADGAHPLLLIDGTWRLAEAMFRSVAASNQLILRSLPAELRTAYPRRQTACSDPERGLASVEALFAAHALLGRQTEGLLDNYYWAEEFLQKNPCLNNSV